LINLDDLYDLNHEVPGEISPKNFRSPEIVSTPDKLSEEGTRSHKVKQTVRVDIERLDNLMNLVGELVISKGQLEQIGLTQHHTDLNDVIEQLERITNDLQSVVMNVRMVPIEQVFNRFPRMVRDLAKELGKDIEFIIEGKETELDRTVIDEIGDPLVHLLRNAVDHGIEYPQIRRQNGKPSTGLVRLVARHEGNNVFIEVTDDGGGFDLETIRAKALEKGLASPQDLSSMTPGQVTDLLFRPGFSTAQNVTDVSGRGVGLDVVKNKIESLNGEIQVDTVLGQGTTFKIRLPLTLAIIQALLVKVGNETFAIPLSSVDETTMIKKSDLKMIQSQEVVVLRGKVLPLVYARRLLESPEQGIAEEEMYVVVVRKVDKQLGIIVDSLIGQQEIVIKSLGKLLIGIPGVAGATILGDGAVSLILDVGTLV
jgi:two-component system chemotaxis sensor kinase CheA